MTSLEATIKSQYAKVFTKQDYAVFLKTAEYYLRRAAVMKTSDIEVEECLRLWLRNVQKRLFIGIGVELLLKSVYLKMGYTINKHNKSKIPEIIGAQENVEIDQNDTFTIAQLIDNLGKVHSFEDIKSLKYGLNIAKVFRNKEGHVATLWHDFDPENYTAIEVSVKQLYKEIFEVDLDFQISMERNEKGIFEQVN